MQPFARFRFLYISSTTDPGPTARRLLHLGTHELTLTLLYTITTIHTKSKQRSDLHFTTNSTRPVVLSRQIRRDTRLNPTALTILTRVSRKHSREYVEYVGNKLGLNRARGHQRSCQPTLAPVSTYLARTGEKKSFYPLGRRISLIPVPSLTKWSLGDETVAASENTRTLTGTLL
ncbi:hypothetical protein V1478_018547 [Vespula squamosa]|uniref:Uncharacterized protein n=1 Tax=Vespula squamosa TaxID=30214 RepID=A0ABD1ZT27_VESSQ